MAADEGGELTMALARSAANQSPEAREALTEAARDRFAGQSQRGAQFIRNLTGGTDATTTQEGLQAAAAEQPTSRPMRKPMPRVRAACGHPSSSGWQVPMRFRPPCSLHASKAKDEAIVSGYGAINSAHHVHGRWPHTVQPRPNGVPTYPDLQYLGSGAA